MLQNSTLYAQDVLDYRLYTDVNKGSLDLIVLRYMARRLHLALLQETAGTSSPSLTYAQERHGRMHRIAIYDPHKLQTQQSLAFVGFVSKKHQPLSPTVIEYIDDVDAKLLAELAGAPGMYSYSSLELRTGNWYNLVVFNDASTKQHIQDSSTHKYAAYQLAPHYYEWIRLHNGSMSGGLPELNLSLHKTKIYTFQLLSARPVIREITYRNGALPALSNDSATDKRPVGSHVPLTIETVPMKAFC